MSVIYKIVNDVTNKILIGVSDKDENFAFNQWMRNCRRQKFEEYDIYKDYQLYDKRSFRVEKLEEVDGKGRAQELADNLIDQLNTIEPNGYNRSYLGIRKRTPNYYDNMKNENFSISIDEDVSVGKRVAIENEMIDNYGITSLVEPTYKKKYSNADTVKGLRKLADDLERYGNVNVLSVVPKELNDELEQNGKGISQILKRRAMLNPDKEYVISPADSVLCIRCGRYRDADANFYLHPDSSATFDGYIHICRECIEKYSEQIYNFCKNALYTIISITQLTNIIFVQEIAEMAATNWDRNKASPNDIGKYYFTELKSVWLKRKNTPRSLLEFRNSNFVGDILSFEEHHPATPRVLIESLNSNVLEKKLKTDKTVVENMEQKWGKGFKVDEYEGLEEEYIKLEKFLPKKTELHIEALKKYVIYGFKEKQALADGRDLKEVKEWSGLADKAAENAQLKIKQLSADFGDGVNSFAKLAETVEEYYSVIPTLPKARKMPYDDMDFLIWQIVNYIRRLEGKPETTYQEVYQFYDEELTKKMRDSGMTEDQIALAKDERNAVFKDLSDAYAEPLWLLPTLNEDEDDDEGGGL